MTEDVAVDEQREELLEDDWLDRLDPFPIRALFTAGFDSIQTELGRIRRRIARGREYATDREALAACELALRELRADYRAALRIRLELFDDDGERLGDALDVALIHVDELVRDGLSLRTIALETREALREYRDADYALVLYELAGSGGSPLGRP